MAPQALRCVFACFGSIANRDGGPFPKATLENSQRAGSVAIFQSLSGEQCIPPVRRRTRLPLVNHDSYSNRLSYCDRSRQIAPMQLNRLPISTVRSDYVAFLATKNVFLLRSFEFRRFSTNWKCNLRTRSYTKRKNYFEIFVPVHPHVPLAMFQGNGKCHAAAREAEPWLVEVLSFFFGILRIPSIPTNLALEA